MTASNAATIDVESERAQTPGTSSVNHLNNAGASLATRVVTDTVVDHVRREAAIGGYEAAAEAAESTDAVYRSIANLIGADPGEIAQLESATSAWNAAFSAVPFKKGDRILTGRTEYPSNALNLLLAQQRHGVEIVVVDDDEDGQISLDALRAAIDERTKLIALTHVPTSGGLVNPAAEVGQIAKQAGILYLLDACQSVGQLPIDVDAIGCDFLSAAGRKFLRGPRGTGFLYARTTVLDRVRPATLDIRSSTWTAPFTYEIAAGARRFESWEYSLANRLGLGAAIEHALALGIDAISERTVGLAESLRDLLRAVPGVRVHDKGVQRCGIVTFGVDCVEALEVQSALSAANVNTTITEAAVARFDFPGRGLDRLVRASPHYYNTDEELAELVEVVATFA